MLPYTDPRKMPGITRNESGIGITGSSTYHSPTHSFEKNVEPSGNRTIINNIAGTLAGSFCQGSSMTSGTALQGGTQQVFQRHTDQPQVQHPFNKQHIQVDTG